MSTGTVQRVTVLGSTGSIGTSTLDVLARHPDRYRVHALSANSNLVELLEQVRRHHPAVAVVGAANLAQEFSGMLAAAGISGVEVAHGVDGLCTIAAASETDVVMAAIVGAAGLAPTLAAAEAGKRVLLANKEALVMAGPVFMRAVESSGALLLPIDSEHNAIFQCLPQTAAQGLTAAGVRKILLTASGGPFRGYGAAELAAVTPAQACAHPNWDMGKKISVDSATLMNKGLEIIEACWLFELAESDIDVVVHPQSIIHSMVEYRDGSVLAQLGNPDMRTPIAHALAWPERIESGVPSLDIIAQARLDFEAPDLVRFPCLRLAREAAKAGGTASALLNAANEVAVAAFLEGRLGFERIPQVVDAVLQSEVAVEPDSLATVLTADAAARERAAQLLNAQPAI